MTVRVSTYILPNINTLSIHTGISLISASKNRPESRDREHF